MKKILKKIGAVLMALCMVLSMLPVATLATEDAPQLVDGYYEIYTADQLYWFAEQVNSGNNAINGKLMADIVVNENVLNADGTLNGDGSNYREWVSIGDGNNMYSGVFDGNGKSISGLYVNDYISPDVGLFGTIGYESKVKNVGIIDSYIRGVSCGGVVSSNHGTVENCISNCQISGIYGVGGVVGYSWNGIVRNCHNAGYITGKEEIGGVVGGADNNSMVIKCYNSGTVMGGGDSYDCGGVVGYTAGSSVIDCYNIGSISGEISVGGVVGCNNYESIMYNCYNKGIVRGIEAVGGIAGLTYTSSSIVSSCYNIGSVSGSYYVGAVIGWNDNGTIINCYYLPGCATDGDGVVQNGTGCQTQGSVTEDAEGAITAKTAEQFASGEVCWLLSGSPLPMKSVKNSDENPWGQKIGKDSYPVFSEDKVIPIVDEGGDVVGFENEITGVTISGNVTSYLEGDTTIELIQDGEVVHSATVSGGEYAIEGVVAGEYTLRISKANHAPVEMDITVGEEPVTFDATIYPVGDVTGDGNVNIKDFQRLLRHVNKTNPLTDYELACGDVTGDGVCNIKDFQRLLRHVNKTNPLF